MEALTVTVHSRNTGEKSCSSRAAVHSALLSMTSELYDCPLQPVPFPVGLRGGHSIRGTNATAAQKAACLTIQNQSSTGFGPFIKQRLFPILSEEPSGHDRSKMGVTHYLQSKPALSRSSSSIFLGVAVFALLAVAGRAPANEYRSDYAATVYFGRMTDVHSWHNIFLDPGQVGFVDANLFAGAISLTLARYLENALNIELEGQVVRYFGDQDNWEFNLPVAVRWGRFPWNNTVETTAAFGLGPSYATEVPPVEVELDGDSKKLLAYWFVELTAGPPKASWTTVLRLHHRSGGFGALSKDGGSNSLALGLKFRF
jgi:hypothetical protein